MTDFFLARRMYAAYSCLCISVEESKLLTKDELAKLEEVRKLVFMNYQWAKGDGDFDVSIPAEAQFVHYKPFKSPIPTQSPCGVPNGLTPKMWLIFSHDTDCITCPICKSISEKEEDNA